MYFLSNRDTNAMELIAAGDLFARYGGERVAADVVKRGGGMPEFLRRMRERVGSQVDNPLADLAGEQTGCWSIVNAIRAALEGRDAAPFEADISSLFTSRSGRVPNGIYAPLKLVTRDFNAGTASEAGNFIGSAVGADLRDPPEYATFMQQLGVSIIPNLKETMHLPKFEQSDGGFSTEVGWAELYLLTTADVPFEPKRYAARFEMSRQALRQSTPELDKLISRFVTRRLFGQIEYDFINSDGVGGVPTGLRATSGIGEVVGGTNGATLAWAHLTDLENKVETANCPPSEKSGFLVNPATKKYLRETPRGSGLPYIWEDAAAPLLGHRAISTNIMPADLDKGASTGVCSSLCFSNDWSQAVLGIYGPAAFDLTIDPVTAADRGKILVTAALYVGIGLAQSAHFAKMDDALLS